MREIKLVYLTKVEDDCGDQLNEAINNLFEDIKGCRKNIIDIRNLFKLEKIDVA